MKKLLSFFFLLLGFSPFAQTLDGINAEHLPANTNNQSSANQQHFFPQRIKLSTGVELEYVEQGDATGVPVILLHGLADSWHSFETVLPHLPQSVHAFALTQRGHGNSEKPSEGYTPKHFADDVAAFMKQKGLTSAVIVGHSMGGTVAQQFTISYPALVKGVVIVCSDASLKDNEGAEDFYTMTLQLTDPIDKEFMDGFQKGTIVKPVDKAYYDTLVAEGLKIPARAFQAVIRGMIDTDLLPLLPAITKPALIVWGSKDVLSPLNDQLLMRNKIKGARLLIYKGAGHALHWEEPKRFATDLLHFIQPLNATSHETKKKR